MANTLVERVRYYERQYLGVDDFKAEQDYDRDQLRRHLLGEHTWGIVVGLELYEQDKDGGAPGVDIFITPGMAIDGLGHQIVLTEPYQLPEELFASYVFNPASPDGQWFPVWLRYREENTAPPAPGYAQCDVTDQESRTIETFRVVVGNLTDSQQRDKITVNGKLVEATDELPDASVPYQDLTATDSTRWLLQLGFVRWLAKANPAADGDHFVKSQSDTEKKKAREGRAYAGNVTSKMFAPAGKLEIVDRFSDPLPTLATDEHYPGVAVTLRGSLEVDRLLDAKQDVEIDGGKLLFDDAGGSDQNIPIWVQRQLDSTGTITNLRVHLGDKTGKDGAGVRLSIGPKDGSDEKAVLAIKADDTVDIPTGALNFGKAQRQMLNLGNDSSGNAVYGIGVQNGTQYSRTQSDFRWYRGGQHKDDPTDPANGALQLRLDDQARLFMGEQTRQMLNLWRTGYGIGVQNATLYFRSDFGFAWFRGGDHSNSTNDPGAGGQKSMTLNDNGDLWVRGNIFAAGFTGPGGSVPTNITAIDVQMGSYYVGLNPNGDTGTNTESRTVSVTSALTTTTDANIVAAPSHIYNHLAATNARWRVTFTGKTKTGPNKWDFQFDVQVDDNDGYFIDMIWVAVFRGSY